jgi:hypothetical protein|tara:strand:- start:7771 stop:10701 length:2931 start_codon:yes stop_codon:yes gene_type:complete
MDTKQFLELVLPSEGQIVLGLVKFKTDGSSYFDFTGYDTIDQATEVALHHDANGQTIYYGVNSFHPEYFDELKNKPRIRTQENVHMCRSLFDDYDVDVNEDSKYSTRPEAFNDIVKFAQALRLTPTITSSGGGYHAYIHLDQDIDTDTWTELSALKRDVSEHLKLKADRSVDMDISQILRPVGTHNRKTDTPRPVELVKLGKTYSVNKIRETFQNYIREHNVSPAPTRKKAGEPSPFSVLSGGYPASDAELVAKNCAAVREFKESGGNISEPHWHRAIGVVKFCEDGEAAIHQWSAGHENYSEAETQQKVNEWTVGPTSCIEMDKHIGCMEACPFKDKCKFPLSLGYSEKAESTEEETVAPVPAVQNTATVIEGQSIPYWPTNGYRWNGAALSRSVVDDDGVVHWRPFSRSFIYPINRIQDTEGTWVVHWRAKEKNGKWREFFMPTMELASTDLMAKTFAANEIFLMRTRNARNDMAEFAEGLIETLQAWRIETKTHNQFGWLPDRSGFVMGTRVITADDEHEVLCDADIPRDIATDFGRSGTLDEWISNIDKLYNRAGAEPFQFGLCHSMGSALVELMGSSNWHGLPLAFTGHGGTGKSTAAKIACGFYGNPEYMERQTGEQGSTLNAAIKRIAIMGSVPMLLDEFSGRTPDELTRTGYALANGRDKERLGTNGKFSTVGGQWFKNSFITSNDSILESISKLPAGYRVEATQLRFFEVSLPGDYRSRVFPDITQEFVENHMDNVYGEPFRPYIRFIIKNQDWVRRQMVSARSKFNPSSEDDNKERFYRDTIVTAVVAGKIAEKLGLISFDLKGMKKWATEQVLRMRENRKETNTSISEHVATFISTLPGRLIITKHFGDARSKHKENPMEILRAPAIGRVCTEDKKVYITYKSLSDWCKDNGVPPAAMKEELDKSGYLLAQPDGTFTPRIYLGSGSTVPSGQSRCYEIKYHKLFDGTALALVETDDGVVTESASK